MDLGTSRGSVLGRSKESIYICNWRKKGFVRKISLWFVVCHLCGCSGLLVSLLSTDELFLSGEESGGFCIGVVDRRATPVGVEVCVVVVVVGGGGGGGEEVERRGVEM